MCGELVIAGHILDASELILGYDLSDRDHLHAVLLAARCEHEQVVEVAQVLAVLERFAQHIDVLILQDRVSHIEDETGMTDILEVSAATRREDFCC